MKKIYLTINWLISSILSFLPTKMNYIIFESYPDFDGSPKKIYDEFIRRNVQKKFRLVWAVDKSQRSLSSQYDVIVSFGRGTIFERIKKKWALMHAKLIVDSNRFVWKLNPRTRRLYTQHGSALKKMSAYSNEIGSVDYVLSISDEMKKIESDFEYTSLKETNVEFLVLGHPFDDALFEKKDLYKIGFWTKCLGNEHRFKKIIGWMPTYRNHKQSSNSVYKRTFPVGVPLLNSEKDLDALNELLEKNDVLLTVQIHHAQVNEFPQKNYSNIILLHHELNVEFDVTLANLLQSFDALITDYSSIYYEFLLLNRPVALSIDDYEEYQETYGFLVDYFDLIKGVYLKDTSDLVHFIEDVANDVDSAKDEREKSLHRIHKYVDGQSTKRVVDFLIEKAKL